MEATNRLLSGMILQVYIYIFLQSTKENNGVPRVPAPKNIMSKVGPSIQKAWNFDAKVTMGTYLGRIAVWGNMDESRQKILHQRDVHIYTDQRYIHTYLWEKTEEN